MLLEISKQRELPVRAGGGLQGRRRCCLWLSEPFQPVRLQHRRGAGTGLQTDENEQTHGEHVDQPCGVKRSPSAFPHPWQNRVSLVVVSVSLKHHLGSEYLCSIVFRGTALRLSSAASGKIRNLFHYLRFTKELYA